MKILALILLWGVTVAANAATPAEREALLQEILNAHKLPRIAENQSFREAIAGGYFDSMAGELQQYLGFRDRYDATSVAIYVSLPEKFREALGPFPGTFCEQLATKRLHILNRDALQIALDKEISINQKVMDGIKLLGRQYPNIEDRDTLNAGIQECYPK